MIQIAIDVLCWVILWSAIITVAVGVVTLMAALVIWVVEGFRHDDD